jgi:hypothetical protein
MVKKFSDLKKGDSIYYFNKNFIEYGYHEKVLAYDFQEHPAWYTTEATDNFIIIIDKRSFNKSVHTSKYFTFATTLEGLKKASKKDIEKGLVVVQKDIDKFNKKIDDLNKKKESITKLLQ